MVISNTAFVSFPNAIAGLLFDDSLNSLYPIRYYHAIDGSGFDPLTDCSYFVFVYDGTAALSLESGLSATLVKDTYFSHHGLFTLEGVFKAIVIEVCDAGYYRSAQYRAMTAIGGTIEETGRLRYIDGCTDSLLIAPVKKGNPCLNHLHFPPGTIQTPHTHPSHRIGLVIRGKGECITAEGVTPLIPGCIFLIRENGVHKFDTADSHLDVIAFHPDSDFGAEDDYHPMINRTIVDGVSARNLAGIRTL